MVASIPTGITTSRRAASTLLEPGLELETQGPHPHPMPHIPPSSPSASPSAAEIETVLQSAGGEGEQLRGRRGAFELWQSWCRGTESPGHSPAAAQWSKHTPGPLPIHTSQLGRILLTPTSSPQSFKHKHEKKYHSALSDILRGRKSHPARPPLTQTPPPLCCPQRGLYNLNKFHYTAQKVCPGQGALGKKARNLPALCSSPWEHQARNQH